MRSFFQSKPAELTSAHGFTTPFNVESPGPARRRGREPVQPWQDERILTSSYFIDPIPGALPNISALHSQPEVRFF
ncbi:MAG: hypothetical protein JNL92_15595 [Opitutaceae bacterium]|nr:hypothetical protein [Opitutaceae bacterium]